MISHALALAFARLGYAVSVLGVMKPAKWPGPEAAEAAVRAAGPQEHVSYSFVLRGQPDTAEQITQAVQQADADIVYCFGWEAAQLARRSRPRGSVVCTFYDPPHQPGLFKRLTELRYGGVRTKLLALRRLWGTVRAIDDKPMLEGLAAADLIIGHAYNHARQYQKKLSRDVLYFPNPLGEVAPLLRKIGNPPAFLMAGSLNSTVSTAGLYYFCRKVLPHLRADLDADRFTIRIVGGGKPPADLAPLLAHRNIAVPGFVGEDALMEEYAAAAALLVPTPIPLGFRTRIVDAFRFGLPTIVHSANRSGFHELQDGVNCSMTSDGADFANRIKAVARDPGSLDGIAARAHEEFTRLYSAEVFCDRIERALALRAEEQAR